MPNAASYELWAWWDSGTGWQRIGGALTGRSYTHENLTTGTVYWYAIQAVDANGEKGAWSAYVSASLAPAGAPVLAATAGTGQITLSWGAVANAASYELWAWWDSGIGWQRIGGALTGSSYTHENLTTGTTYWYAIRAVGASGDKGAWSAFANAAPM